MSIRPQSCVMSRRRKLAIFSRRSKLERAVMDSGTQTAVTPICKNPTGAVSTMVAPILASDPHLSDPDSSPDISFPSFEYLPTEIRLKIWQSAFPVRILRIIPHPPLMRSSAPSFICSEPPPVLLSVCRESRYETLRFYCVVSDKHKGRPPSSRLPSFSSSPGHRFYFNPYTDTIFVDASRAESNWLRMLRVIESHSRIMSLALRNAHHFPHTFAVEVVAERGVREMFVVGDFEEFGWTPEMWALLPRGEERRGGVMGGESCCGGVVRCIEKWEYEAERMPSVTAVKEEFWVRGGLGVVGRW